MLNCPHHPERAQEIKWMRLTKDGNKAVVWLLGRFDFNTPREFRAEVDPLVSAALRILPMLCEKIVAPGRKSLLPFFTGMSNKHSILPTSRSSLR
jgi:hypothetical protein